MSEFRPMERVQVVVIGGGQAGLSVGYHLARRGVRFVILEAKERIGDSWRERWDSLRLFTTRRLDSLDGMPFPGSSHEFPTKNEMADYLEAYAARFALPIRTGVRVTNLTRQGERYLVSAGDQRFEADHVVVAMATYQEPKIPAFAAELAPEIGQLHSLEYRRPSQLKPGGVLVVGAGNSGAEIALEAVRNGHPTWLSGRHTGNVPFDIETLLSRYVFQPLLLRVIFHRLLTVDTPVGRKARPKIISAGGPLIRTKPKDLLAAGVRRVGRTAGIRDGKPVLDDGTVLDVTNVVWCTGFHPGFSWIDLPVLDEHGEPRHERGLLPDEPGLSFVGLHFLYSMSSTMIHGVGRDAERVAEAAAARVKAVDGLRRQAPVVAA
ncbi:MAG TPA: FAD-dependent oxidoreductase [Gemmatimonadales bacterium]|nr:FAD-dependent oxidoreductase [Gemmatimonadales bacterium]